MLIYENHSNPSVVVSGYLWAGALSERPDKAGLSSYTAGMLMRGTESRTFRQINKSLESVGAQLGLYGGIHLVGFGGKALAEDLDLLLDILADCLQKPVFPPDEVEKLRGQILTSLERRAQDTRRMARLTFNALLYPDHPYGRSAQGYNETISGLDRDDLEAYYREHYSPQGMVMAIVGAVQTNDILERTRAKLGNWQAQCRDPNRTIPPAVHLTDPVRRTVPIEGKAQSDLILGWPGMARDDPNYVKANLANTVLGIFGMMGRLGDNVREEQGLAYYVYSQLEAGLGAGPWFAAAGVHPSNVDQAVESILYEVRRLREEPVPIAELADSQSFLTGSMPLHLETNEGVARTLLDIERHGLGLDYLQRYADLVNGVTVEDVQQVARQYLEPEVYALAIAGPDNQ
jgi:zinc protease